MSFSTLLKTIINKELAPGAPKPMRTKTPLRLSQGSAVTISITPLILADDAGALFKSDLSMDHKIYAVGQLSLFGVTYYRAYLSQSKEGFIQFAMKDGELLETRLFRWYDEIEPDTAVDWAFWLADADGYIGLPTARSHDSDGGLSYQRTWGGGDQRIPPFLAVETLVGETGFTTTARHRMMLYGRALKDPQLAEHLLVSVVETDTVASVNFWLGLDLAAQDLTVFPAADAPL